MTDEESNDAVAEAGKAYEPRYPMFETMCRTLEREVVNLLHGVPRIDRIAFRPKGINSFARKAVAKTDEGNIKYDFPLSDIEDQVAGRVLVFFRSDIDVVVEKLKTRFNPAEHVRKEPVAVESFSYESEHLVFRIPPDVKPDDWSTLTEPPLCFEMQVRTLFMHAWAEPQHDISYKPNVKLTREEKRSVAWAASNAWGGDQIFEDLFQAIKARA